MTTLNMHPITGPGGKEKNRLYADQNVDRGFYSYFGMFNDEYSQTNRNIGFNRPVFKIMINPKAHCQMHNEFEPYEYIDSRPTKY